MPESAADLVRERLREGAELVEAMLADEPCLEAIAAAAEFVGRYLVDRRPLPALALVENPSSLTAIGNDYGYEQVFSRQVRAQGVRGDVAIGLTTSGRSANVAAGLEAAAELGLETVAMTGADPGPVGAAAALTIAIPSRDTPRVQEGQMLAAHTICEWVESRLAAPR